MKYWQYANPAGYVAIGALLGYAVGVCLIGLYEWRDRRRMPRVSR